MTRDKDDPKILYDLLGTKDHRKELDRQFKNPKSNFKIAILVDDGVATGSTVLCAQKYFKKQKTNKIILATPVIAKDTLRSINEYFDDVIILEVPDEFYAIGQFYKDFTQVSDKEVIKILNKNQ